MHNLTKIRIFRLLLWVSYPLSLLIIYPFARARRKSPTGLFFFFDRYSIGGAQRIHLDILESVSDLEKFVFFTRKSPNNKLKETFYSVPNSINSDIHFWCDNLLFRLFTVHYFAFYLNSHKKAHILSANSTFFYDLLPFLKAPVICSELLHNFSYGKNGMEFFGLANYQRLNYRIVYDSFTLSNIRNQYSEFRIPPAFLERIRFIEPGVNLLTEKPVKDFSFPVKILYAGRGGPQKRVWLINRIAEFIIQKNWPVHFSFAGTMSDELSETTKKNSTLYGEVSSAEKMNEIYASSHFIILTSAYEGFPMVIKEGMARACIPFVTALEGNRMHLKHEENALLIHAIEDEAALVQEAIQIIEKIIQNPEQIPVLSDKAWQYAHTHFDKKNFLKTYRQFLLGELQTGS